MIKGYLKKQGIEFSEKEEADILILNSCAVKDKTEHKMIARTKEFCRISENTKAKVIVTGCLPKVNPLRISGVSEKIIQFGPELERITKELDLKEEKYCPYTEQEKESNITAIIPIEQGCLSNCSYCATKLARGNLKSFGIEDLKKKFELELEKGAKEFFLTGVDLGCYGFEKGKKLTDLLKELLEFEGDYRIRIGMTNPQYLNSLKEELLELYKDERLYLFLHSPIQSASNNVLKKMKRGYRKENWIEGVKEFRREFKDLTVWTDVICGFPEETREEFQETIEALKEAKPDNVNVSRYSRRPNTEAFEMKQLLGKEAKERTREAAEVSEMLSVKRNKRMENRKEKVLVVEKGSRNTVKARTRNYKLCVLKEGILGEFLEAKLERSHANYIEAMHILK